MPSTFQRHFTFLHPLFREKKTKAGIWWENSVYYLWWEFLRRHGGYKRCCENGGKGQYAKLYVDFGDVHGVSFRQWWTAADRGARLFSEPPLPTSLHVIKPSQAEGLSEAVERGSLLLIAVPINLRKRFITQKFNKILSKFNRRKRGQRTLKESRALFPIATQFNIHSLKQILDVHDLRASDKNLRLWEIGQRLKLNVGQQLTAAQLASDKWDPDVVSKKNILAITASKKLKLAKKIIDGAGRGVFPANSVK